MTTNVGTLDCILRATLGPVLLYLAFLSGMQLSSEPLFNFGAAVIGVVMLAISIMKMCPLHATLDLKTCREC